MGSDKAAVLTEAVQRGRRGSCLISRAFILLVAVFNLLTAVSFWPGTQYTARYIAQSMDSSSLAAYSLLWVVGAVMAAVALIWSSWWRIAAPFIGALMASLVAVYTYQWLTGDSEVRWYSVKNYSFMWAVYLVAVYHTTYYLPRGDGGRRV